MVYLSEMSGFENERETPDYDTIMNMVQQTFAENREITLATSYNDRVTSRTVSFVNKDSIIYFISWEHNKKVVQIAKNDWMKAAVLRAAGILPDGSIRSHSKRGS